MERRTERTPLGSKKRLKREKKENEKLLGGESLLLRWVVLWDGIPLGNRPSGRIHGKELTL